MSGSLVAVDIGNSFLHLARYAADDGSDGLWPTPLEWWDPAVPHLLRAEQATDSFRSLLPPEPAGWYVTSVHRGHESRLREWLQAARPQDTLTRLGWRDFRDGLGLVMDVEYPERVGLDRLAAACAINLVRPRGRAAIVVDAGTALTVDLIDAQGVFRGGAIFPGLRLLADALHHFTDALPRVSLPQLPPAAVGRHTEAAIHSGLYHGGVGAVRELVAAIAAGQPNRPLVVVTGGQVWQDALCDWEPRVVPDLVVAGTALAARRLASRAAVPNPQANLPGEGGPHAGELE